MNSPEYIVQDEFGTLVEAAKTALGLTNLNYQHGYVREIQETLRQYSEGGLSAQKYPLVWLVEPIKIQLLSSGDFFGETRLRWLVINSAEPNKKSKARLDGNFKTVLHPIYRQMMIEIANSGIFTSADDESKKIVHTKTDRPYWGENQQLVFTDMVDVIDVEDMELKIYNNHNSTC